MALSFGSAPVVKVETRKLVKFLPSYNEALDKALKVHNLMTEVPELQIVAEQQTKLDEKAKQMEKYFDMLLKCNEQRFGRFKNNKEVLAKVRAAYKERTKDLKDEEGSYSEGSIIPRSLSDRNALWSRKKNIEQEIMVDALTNTRKWGGQMAGRRQQDVPTDMKDKMVGTGLEELMISEDGVQNMRTAKADLQNEFKKMQQSFLQRLAEVGVSMNDFDASRAADIRKLQKTLKDLKDKHLAEAKEYVEKLDAQDAAHPQAVARRTAATQNKKKVVSRVQEQFPEAFAEMHKFDQQTPQQRQRDLIAALEKDENGSVYLTETNALEVDQRLAEAKSSADMLEYVQDQAEAMVDEMQSQYPEASDFDFSVCS